MKNFLGGSVINYGGKLPPANTSIPNGSVFFKTTSDNSQPLGLYVYGILQDSNLSIPGDQPAEGWVEAKTGLIVNDTPTLPPGDHPV